MRVLEAGWQEVPAGGDDATSNTLLHTLLDVACLSSRTLHTRTLIGWEAGNHWMSRTSSQPFMRFGQVGRKSFVEDPEAFAADAAALRARRGALTVISERCDVVQTLVIGPGARPLS